MVAEFMHSVTQSLWTPLPTPCPLLASHTLSPSLSLPLPHSVLSPLLLICLNLSVEPPPSSPHHLSLTTSLSFSTPPTPPHAVSVLLPVSQQQLHTRQSSVSAFTNTPRKTHSYTRTLADTHTHICGQAQTHPHSHAGSSSSLRVATGRPVSLQAFVAVRQMGREQICCTASMYRMIVPLRLCTTGQLPKLENDRLSSVISHWLSRTHTHIQTHSVACCCLSRKHTVAPKTFYVQMKNMQDEKSSKNIVHERAASL